MIFISVSVFIELKRSMNSWLTEIKRKSEAIILFTFNIELSEDIFNIILYNFNNVIIFALLSSSTTILSLNIL